MIEKCDSSDDLVVGASENFGEPDFVVGLFRAVKAGGNLDIILDEFACYFLGQKGKICIDSDSDGDAQLLSIIIDVGEKLFDSIEVQKRFATAEIDIRAVQAVCFD